MRARPQKVPKELARSNLQHRLGKEAWNINLYATERANEGGSLRRHRPIDLESRTSVSLIGPLDLISTTTVVVMLIYDTTDLFHFHLGR